MPEHAGVSEAIKIITSHAGVSQAMKIKTANAVAS